jgi:hypothetical protein
MSKPKHTPFGMDEGVHKMCEELFANRYAKSDTVTISANTGQREPFTKQDFDKIHKRMNNEK